VNKPRGESIFVGLGGNLPHPELGAPATTLQAALNTLKERGIGILRVSRWYRTAPVPASDQPWYENAVAEVETGMSADALLAELHAVEDQFGRQRGEPNAARLIDLDLLDYRGQTALGGPGKATLPHPRLSGRAFVLRPLADLAPDWRHPLLELPIRDLLEALPASQATEPMDPQPGS
jgi:2-amino-4-hydroxy-6-hydroxymethyldihydropteridine diphosphokinase